MNRFSTSLDVGESLGQEEQLQKEQERQREQEKEESSQESGQESLSEPTLSDLYRSAKKNQKQAKKRAKEQLRDDASDAYASDGPEQKVPVYDDPVPPPAKTMHHQTDRPHMKYVLSGVLLVAILAGLFFFSRGGSGSMVSDAIAIDNVPLDIDALPSPESASLPELNLQESEAAESPEQEPPEAPEPEESQPQPSPVDERKARLTALLSQGLSN